MICSLVESVSRAPRVCVCMCVHVFVCECVCSFTLARRFVFASVIIHDLQMEAEILRVAVHAGSCRAVKSPWPYILMWRLECETRANVVYTDRSFRHGRALRELKSGLIDRF